MTETNINILCNKRRYKYVVYIIPFFHTYVLPSVDYVMLTNATSFGQGCKRYCIYFLSRSGLPETIIKSFFFFIWQPHSKWRPSVQVGCTDAMHKPLFKITYSFLSFHKELYHLVLMYSVLKEQKSKFNTKKKSNKHVAFILI